MTLIELRQRVRYAKFIESLHDPEPEMLKAVRETVKDYTGSATEAIFNSKYRHETKVFARLFYIEGVEKAAAKQMSGICERTVQLMRKAMDHVELKAKGKRRGA